MIDVFKVQRSKTNTLPYTLYNKLKKLPGGKISRPFTSLARGKLVVDIRHWYRRSCFSLYSIPYCHVCSVLSYPLKIFSEVSGLRQLLFRGLSRGTGAGIYDLYLKRRIPVRFCDVYCVRRQITQQDMGPQLSPGYMAARFENVWPSTKISVFTVHSLYSHSIPFYSAIVFIWQVGLTVANTGF